MQALLVLKSRHSGSSSSWCTTPGLGSPLWGSNPLLLKENLCSCDYLTLCGLPTHRCGLDYTTSLPLLSISSWFLLYALVVENIFSSLQVVLIVSFSVIVVILVCPWEEVSSDFCHLGPNSCQILFKVCWIYFLKHCNLETVRINH